jgi:hypothetical protein
LCLAVVAWAQSKPGPRVRDIFDRLSERPKPIPPNEQEAPIQERPKGPPPSLKVNGDTSSIQEPIHKMPPAPKLDPKLPPIEISSELPGEAEIGLRIDQFKGGKQLMRPRKQDLTSVDRCAVKGTGQSTFLDAISGAVKMSMAPRKIFSDPDIDSNYGLPGRSKSIEVGLISHPLCMATEASIKHLLGSQNAVDPYIVKSMNIFVDAVNSARIEALGGNSKGMRKAELLYTNFMGCLAYAESLTEPGDSGEKKTEFDSLYKKHIESDESLQAALGDIPRPSGVIYSPDRVGTFYIQTVALRATSALTSDAEEKLKQKYPSWLDIGLFQFKPDLKGNINPCIDQWNERNPSCKIERTMLSVTKALGSPGQTAGAYFGVQKIVEMYNSEVNTMNASGTDLANAEDGTLKTPRDRCVSLIARAGKNRVYSHFGVLADSVGVNLHGLLSCVRQTMPRFANSSQ